MPTPRMVNCYECEREIEDWNAYGLNGHLYCNECISSCDNCGDLLPLGEHICNSCREDRDGNSEIIQGYHDNDPTEMGYWKAGKRQRYDRKTRYFGMELEFEASHDTDLNPLAQQCLDTFHEKAQATEDGSLNHGFEIVTAPMDYDTMHKTLEAVEIPGELRANLGCGLHIHVSRRALTPLTIGKLVVFVHDSKNYELVSHLARRHDTQYCKRSAKKLSWEELYGGRDCDRYQAINTTPANTIEFRLFRSAKTNWRILAALETVQALIDWCEQTSIRDLTAESFQIFVAKHQMRYANLVRLLDAGSHISWANVRTRYPRKAPMPAKYRVPGWHGPANVNEDISEEAA